MTKQSEIESLLSAIITLFADEFGSGAILRGGMVLRLLDSPRLTNDLDYLFVPFKSKNEITKAVVTALRTLDGVEVSYSLNSKCLRCIVKRGEIVVQVEAKVDRVCKVDTLSTAVLSKLHNQTPRVINVMAHEIALAHKLAAWYERRLIRDLYDTYLFLSMGVMPDREILAKRLQKPIFSKKVKTSKTHIELDNFFAFLRHEVESLSNDEVDQELGAILPNEELLGLELKMKKAIMSKF